MPTRRRTTRGPLAWRGVAVLCLVAAVVSPPSPAHADWESDELYIKKLNQRLTELKEAVSLFERHRRALELVEAEIANVQLGLADPRGEPVALVRKVLDGAFPKIRIEMTRVPAEQPAGVGVWRWRCRLSGALEEIRWATQLLRQKGLFVLASAREPVTLAFAPDQRTATLGFIGHHIRLKDTPPGVLPEQPADPDAFANRTDPLAAKIKQLRGEVTTLRTRVADIQGFEARVNSIKQYLALLKSLTSRAQDPFRAITPLLDLELVHFEALVFDGRQVTISGAVLSEGVRPVIRAWLRTVPVRRVKYVMRKQPGRFRPVSGKELPLPRIDVGGGGRHLLIAAGARVVDLCLAVAIHGAAVALTDKERAISGRTTAAPFFMALGAAASALELALIRDGNHVVLVPPGRNSSAFNALKNGAIKGHGRKRTILRRVPYGEALAIGRGLVPSLRAPKRAIASTESTILAGRTRAKTWVRLIGAAGGLQLVSDGKQGLRLQAEAGAGAGAGERSKPGLKGNGQPALLPVRDPAPARPDEDRRHEIRHPLSSLRVRLLVLARTRSFAVVTVGDGMPQLVRKGAFLGRNHSQVVRIDRRGLTLLWSGAGVTRRVLLPIGEPAT